MAYGTYYPAQPLPRSTLTVIALKLGLLRELMMLELVIAPMGFQLLLTLLLSDP